MTLIAALLLVSGSPCLAQPVGASDEEIAASIGRARAWLLQQVADHGQDYAEEGEALVAFALLRSGAPLEQVEPLFVRLRAAPLDVYEAGLYALALEARSLKCEEPDHPWRTRTRGSVPQPDLDELKRVADYLLRAECGQRGCWSYTDLEPQRRAVDVSCYDNSNTQFAVYGLAAASRCGVEIDPRLWGRVLEHWLGEAAKGSPSVDLDLELGPTSVLGSLPRHKTALAAWGYGRLQHPEAPASRFSYTAMTGAGISSLAYALERLHACGAPRSALVKRAERALGAGLGWMQAHLDDVLQPDRRCDVHAGGFTYYSFWSLEKAFDSADVRRVGGRDWWREGAAWALSTQTEDGYWPRCLVSTRLTTAFALLFLSRATLSAAGATAARIEREATDPPGVRTGEPTAGWAAGELEDGRRVASLRQALEQLRVVEDRAQRRQLLEESRSAWEGLDPEWRGGLVTRLLPLLDARGAVRRWAREAAGDLAASRQRPQLAGWGKRWEALALAAAAGDASDMAGTVELLRDAQAPDWLRLRAVRTVAALGGKEAVPALRELLDSHSAALRARAREVLQGLAPEAPDRSADAGAAD